MKFMPIQEIKNFKGGKKTLRTQLFSDDSVKILHGFLEPGASIGEHVHKDDYEILFILSGCGTIIEDGVSTPIYAGDCNYCPRGHSHSLINDGVLILEFYAVVPNAAKKE